jgi:YebC/PmpR family DNA-binding regulatory protein
VIFLGTTSGGFGFPRSFPFEEGPSESLFLFKAVSGLSASSASSQFQLAAGATIVRKGRGGIFPLRSHTIVLSFELLMAGHSKWKQIKHYKAATDAKRGALFTKLIREITMAAKMGGGDPDGNPRLRTAIDTAKGNSMPKENIERAVKKGTGELEGVEYQEILYEGYGPAGVALMIQTVTDNPNRTVAEIRYKLSRGGGNLGAANSVSWMFDRRGQIYLDAARVEEDALIEAALDAGAEDVKREDDQFVVTTGVSDLHAVKSALDAKNLASTSAEIVWLPKNTIRVEGKDAEALVKLLEGLEELDDVQKVEANFDMDVSEMAKA